MKKIFFAAALICGAIVNANAEEMNAPEQVMNIEAEAIEAVEAPEQVTDSTIVVYMVNPVGPEYNPAQAAAVAQAESDRAKKGQTWHVEMPVGNGLEPIDLWSADRYGAYIGVTGKYSHYDDRDLYYIGAEAGYLKRWGGIGAYIDYGQGYQDRTSMSKAKVNELNYGLRAYLPALEWHMGAEGTMLNRSVFSLRPYLELGAKKARDLQYNENSSVSYEEISEGIEITKRYETEKIDARPRVLKWAVGLEVRYDFWGSPISIGVDAEYGKSQNFTYVAPKQWHALGEVNFKLTYRLGNHHGFTKAPAGSPNRYLYQDYGYPREDVKKHDW